MLRLVNAFDESHDHSVTGLSVECENGSISVLAEGLRSLSSTAERVARARYLLESLCKSPIMIRAAMKRRSPAARQMPARRRSSTVSS